MSEQEPPRIEFPCEDYPIKIIGESAPDFRETILNIVERHAPGFDAARMDVVNSRQGNYQSVTLWITATGEEQLSNLNTDLRTCKLVRLVL